MFQTFSKVVFVKKHALSKHGNIELTCNNTLSYALQNSIMMKVIKEQIFCCHCKTKKVYGNQSLKQFLPYKLYIQNNIFHRTLGGHF